MSNRFRYYVNAILILFISNNVNPQTVVTDTIYSIDSLDGGICYFYENDIYSVILGTLDAGPGDGYNAFLWMWQYCRSYYSFPLSSIPYDSTAFELLSATFQVFQHNSYGNDQRGVFPIWDFPGGDTNYCYLDHVTYGDSLWFDDWTAGDEGDVQTLSPLYSIVSSTPDTGFRNINVTSLVETDLIGNRGYTQFRIHFPIDTDYDYYMDLISFSDGEYPFFNHRPKLIIQYQIETVNIAENSVGFTNDFLLHQNYPNPFNSSTQIGYLINTPGHYTVSILDILGKQVAVINQGYHSRGNYHIPWNGKNDSGADLPSGIYIYNLSSQKQMITKKLILLH